VEVPARRQTGLLEQRRHALTGRAVIASTLRASLEHCERLLGRDLSCCQSVTYDGENL
jgi:hypothetical protein